MRAFESIKLRQGSLTVWALVAPAKSSVLLASDTTARAFTVPGTGPGVGEQHCHIDREGQASIIEVAELVPGRRAVAVTVSPKPEVAIRLVTEVEPLGTGCILSHGMEFEIHAGSEWPALSQEAFRLHAAAYLSRVRAVLEDEVGQKTTDR